MERVAIHSGKSGDVFDTTGTIVESVQRNNRTIIKLKIDEGEEGSTLEDGVLFSYPAGRIYITYPDGQIKRFEFVNTVIDPETYIPRDTPLTDAEIDKTIYDRIEINYKRIERDLKEAVKTYVRHGNDQKARAKIADSIDTVWPAVDEEMIVYRGQLKAQEIRTAPAPPRYFFSTSSDPVVSSTAPFFSEEEKCCLFILHIQPGVKYFEVSYDLVPDNFFESEVLIEGNGTFYQDKEKRSIGFRQLTLGDLVNKVKNANVDVGTELNLINVYIEHFQPKRINQNRLTDQDIADGEDQLFFDSLKTLEASELQTKIGVFETYYFPPAREGGRRKRRKTYRNRRRHTRKRRISG